MDHFQEVQQSCDIQFVNFGVKALGSNPRKSRKNGEGELDVAVSFGGIRAKPGNWVYSDEDGVVIANRELSLD